MKKKLIWLFLLVVCVPIGLSVWVTAYFVSNHMTSTLLNRANEGLGVVENLFEEFTNDLALKTRTIAQTKAVQSAIAQRQTLVLIQELGLLRQDLGLQLHEAVIEIYDPRGQRLAAEPHTPQPVASQELIQAALASTVRRNLNMVDSQLQLGVGMPLFHPSKATPIGAAIVTVPINHTFAQEIKKLTNTEVLIFSEPRPGKPALIMASTLILNGEWFAPDLSGWPQQHELQMGQRQLVMRAVLKQASNGNFALGAALDKQEWQDILSSLLRLLYAIGVVALLLALGLALVLTRQLVHPINQLVDAAKALGARELNQPIHIDSQDEFGFLGATFESMRQEIKQMVETLQETNCELDKKVHKLSVMNQINQAIIARSGNELLYEILMIIAEQLQAEHSSIMLLDTTSNRLMLKTVYWRERPHLHHPIYQSFEPGEGIAGYVVQHCETILSNTPQQDPRFKPYGEETQNEQLRNLVCVPLQGDKAILGVINVVNKAEGFDSEDALLLTDIAHPVAVALQNTRLYELSITDGMTQLYIHRYFQAVLEAEVKRAQRYDLKLSLLMFDIDHFKKFNDIYGHQVGDRVIQKVAEILRQNVREGIDIPARYGGEEFAVIMPGTDIEGTYLLAERLRHNIAETVLEHQGVPLNITISLGCAEFPTHAETPEALIARADEALYQSKRGGRNRTSRAGES